MNNFFFIALCLALLYYFFFYLPSQKTNANLPFKQNQATQTNLELANKETQTEPEIEIIDPGPEEEIESLKEDLTNSRQANQKLLAEVNLFSENKELIREAVEFHLNQAQGFLSTYDMSCSAAQEIIRKKLAKEGEYTNREPHIGFEQNCLERWKNQKAKNEKIVAKSQKLLKGLAEKED